MIPHVYDGHNKTFFFTNFDWTRLRSGVLPGFGNTTPIDAFKAGDFSSLGRIKSTIAYSDVVRPTDLRRRDLRSRATAQGIRLRQIRRTGWYSG